MPLTAAIVAALASQCAPEVSTATLLPLVQVESAFDPLAIGVNAPSPAQLHPRTTTEAIEVATRLIASGASVDLGLGQVNSANLAPLGLSVADAFAPCRNLHAAARLLQAAYRSQQPAPGHEQPALRVALSLYNTGRTDRGFLNGYVAKVVAAAGQPVPALQADPPSMPSAGPPSAPSWDVFAQPTAGFVLAPTAPDSSTQGDAP
jgi:type IV secretion system protein VirB1